jgi:hypothetical protein
MAKDNALELMLPVGRLVGGSLVKAKTEDWEGRPLVIKTGPNAGQPRSTFDFAIAIPKNGVANWWETPWGQQVFALAQKAFPGGQTQRPDFAWKITDGDSTIPNLSQKRPCDQDGYPGHWVIWLSSSWAPKTLNAQGTATIDPEKIKLGNCVEAYVEVASNGEQAKAGLYWNHRFVAFSGPHRDGEISVGPDPTTLGFGNAPRPAFVSDMPVGGVTPAQAGVAAAAAPGSVPTPVMPGSVPGAVHGALPAMPGSVPTPVQPNPAMTAGVVAGPPGTVAAPPAAKELTPAGQAALGGTYAQAIAAGWSDAQLIQHGHMTA